MFLVDERITPALDVPPNTADAAHLGSFSVVPQMPQQPVSADEAEDVEESGMAVYQSSNLKGTALNGTAGGAVGRAFENISRFMHDL